LNISGVKHIKQRHKSTWYKSKGIYIVLFQ